MDLLGGMCGFLWVLLVGDTLLAVKRIRFIRQWHKDFEKAIRITARRWGKGISDALHIDFCRLTPCTPMGCR